jgi:hypothetical protein
MDSARPLPRAASRADADCHRRSGTRRPGARDVEQREILIELKRCESGLMTATIDHARVLEDLRETGGCRVGSVQDRFDGLDCRRRVVMVEARACRPELAERIPARRMWTAAKVDAPDQGTARQDVDLGRDLLEVRDRRGRRERLSHE